MVNLFSTTKGDGGPDDRARGVAGLLDYDAGVCDYWPEFAAQTRTP